MRLRLFAGALAFLIAGCDDATGPNVSGLDPLTIARIEIMPELDTLVVQDTLSPGDTLRLRAAVVLRSGGVLTDAQLAWQSSSPSSAPPDWCSRPATAPRPSPPAPARPPRRSWS